jgi:Uma2 family endonuclease
VELADWLRDHPVGELFAAPFDVVFSRLDIVEPDRVYLSNARRSTALTDTHATGADLVIEIAAPGTRKRDASTKLRLYERSDVAEYWLVDPDARRVKRYRRGSERFAAPLELSASRGDVLVTPLFPGTTVSLADLPRD